MPATELATIDNLKEREAGTGEEEVKVGLLDRWADSTPATRQISKVTPCTQTTLAIYTIPVTLSLLCRSRLFSNWVVVVCRADV